ncbi:MAG: acyl-[acyl-carrier-protein]--UDP-N-acetylglucosamine O-acyltransferase [Phycisphaerae bacterium]|nr:acyl-[acyl-carrier-protein]--UDP-N-acetylglucosamine O-acyltransferase [Phycisphaerae bacterium]|tara:strand:- start:5429 stop:6232 length:804 start_codon:yes stop_codon:yes gene_type:complete
MHIHPTALIDATATIAEDATVGPFCVVGPRVTIGSGTRLLDHVTVQSDTTIGIDNVLYPFSVVGGDPQDLKFNGEITTLTVGDRNQIREHVTIHRGTGAGGGVTSIGNDNLFMVASHVAHDCILGSNLVIANQVMLAGHITVEDCATIGGGAGINQFARIGRCSYVGGLARITRDVPPYMIVEGTPAEVRAVNVVAMARRGYEDVQIAAMKEAHRRLFRDNGGALAQKMEELLAELGEHAHVQHLCEAMTAAAAGKHGRSNEKVATS